MSRTTRAKACWSSSIAGQVVEVGAGLLLDPVAPEVDHALAALRRGAAGQLLAHHQRQRFLDRRVGLVADVGEVGLGVFVLQHRADIVGDAGHAARADRLDAGLLDRIEDRRAPACPRARIVVWMRGRGRRASAPWNRRGRA